jgi:hypothetical protein
MNDRRVEASLQEIPLNDKLLRRIEWISGVLMLLLPLGAWVGFSWKTALGVFFGGVVAIASFQALKWQLKRAFKNPAKIPSKGGLFASYYLRFLGTVFVIFVVIYYGLANPIAFLIGLSVVVVSILMVGGQEFLLMLAEKKGEG